MKQAVAERSVEENKDGEKVGDPVVAADKDLLIYADDSDYFSVDNDGQISTAMELDYESLPDDAKYHMIMLTATDPSGATDSDHGEDHGDGRTGQRGHHRGQGVLLR